MSTYTVEYITAQLTSFDNLIRAAIRDGKIEEVMQDKGEEIVSKDYIRYKVINMLERENFT